MNTKGFIQLSREFLNWQWYDDDSAMRVFLHLLLTANFTCVQWHGMTIERGQRVITLNSLADEIGVSKTCILKTLKKLEKSGDIEQSATSKFTVITVKNYDDFTMCLPSGDQMGTNEKPMRDRKETAYYNNNNNKENKNNNFIKKSNSKSSFDIDELERQALERYAKKTSQD